MKHIFDVDIAKKYGVNAAVLLENLGYWIRHNEANGTNFYDGNYWTYNSRKALKELFPYLGEKQIYTAMRKLIDEGLVITGNYNKSAYDRTTWYALTEKGKSIFLNGEIQDDETETSIVQKGKMERNKKDNGFDQTERPIPDINTDINSNINSNINTDTEKAVAKAVADDEIENKKTMSETKSEKKKGIDYQAIVNAFKEICTSFPTVRFLSEKRKEAIRARFKKGYTQDDFIMVFQKAQASNFLKGENKSGWSANFDWLINESNMVKVLEGNYDNKEQNNTNKKSNGEIEYKDLPTLGDTPIGVWQ